MSTENENKPEGTEKEENQNVSREGGYKPYDRENSYNQYNSDGEQRPYRQRVNYNQEGTDRPYRPSYNSGERSSYNRYGNGERPPRPRFNPNREEGEQQRAYTPRPRFNPNREDGGQRAYTPRPRFSSNREDGEQRAYTPRPRFNPNREDGEQRAYTPRPRFNSNREEGEQRAYTPRPRFNSNREEGEQRAYTPRPRFNPNREEGEQRSYTPRPRFNSNREGSEQRSYTPRPRFNSNREGGEQRSYTPRPRMGGYQGNGYNRPARPHAGGYNQNAKYNNMKKPVEYKDVWIDPNEPIRLNKFIANAGICSRREADEFITAGVISVNGTVVTELGTKIKRTDDVKFHDRPVSVERKVYVLLNKPKDCVTTSDDPQERKTVMDFVKGACKERIYPVGRLDRNTTGVLLLTNDGDLASKLTHPKYLKKKIYHVYCDKNVAEADLERIASGVTLDDEEVRADNISYSSDTDKSQVGIEIHSGKNRIVRRIFESLGYRVVKLDRVYFAGLTKKGLRRGDWRYLTEQEVNFLRMGSFE